MLIERFWKLIEWYLYVNKWFLSYIFVDWMIVFDFFVIKRIMMLDRSYILVDLMVELYYIVLKSY